MHASCCLSRSLAIATSGPVLVMINVVPANDLVEDLLRALGQIGLSGHAACKGEPAAWLVRVAFVGLSASSHRTKLEDDSSYGGGLVRAEPVDQAV